MVLDLFSAERHDRQTQTVSLTKINQKMNDEDVNEAEQENKDLYSNLPFLHSSDVWEHEFIIWTEERKRVKEWKRQLLD